MPNRKTAVRLAAVTLLLVAALAPVGCSRESRVQRHVRRAASFYERGKYAEAAIEAQHALRLDKENDDALRYLALSAMEAGDLRSAAQLLPRAAERFPDDVAVQTRLGILYLAAQRPADAREAAERILADHPGNSSALALLADAARSSNEVARAMTFLRESQALATNPALAIAKATLHLRSGDMEAAEAEFRRAVGLDEQFSKPYLGLAGIYRQRGETEKALEAYRAAADRAAPASVERVQLVEFYLGQDNTDEARRILEQIVAERPNYTPALYLRARLNLQERNTADAAEDVKRVLAVQPDHVGARELEARLMLLDGRTGEAVASLRRLVTEHPKVSSLRYRLAQALVLRRDIESAITELDAATAADPTNLPAFLLRAELQIRAGRPEEAVAVLGVLAERMPGEARVHALHGAALRAAGRDEDAIDAYRRFVELSPGDARSYYLLGRALGASGKPDEAIDVLERAVEKIPAYIPAVSQLVAIDLAAGRTNAALQRVARQLELVTGSAGLHHLQGRLQLSLGDTESAKKSFQTALELEPRSVGSAILLARLYAAEGETASALASIEQALERRPKDIAMLMMAGMLHQQRGDTEKAIAVYERVLDIDPDSPAAANNLAYLYSGVPGKLDKALDLAQRAREASPDDPFVADTLGWVAHLTGDHAWALSLLRESAAQLPDQPEVHYHLAMVYNALGNQREARENLETAVATDRDFPGKANAQRLLDVLQLDPAQAPEAEATAKLEALLAEDPENITAKTKLAGVKRAAGKAAEARALYEEVLEDRPESLDAIRGLAELLSELPGTLDRAIELTRQARDRVPDDADLTLLLGRLALRKGNAEWAAGLLKEGLRKEEEDPRGRYNLAVAQYILGDMTAARRNLEMMPKDGAERPALDKARRFAALLDLLGADGAIMEPPPVMTEALEEDPDFLPALMVRARHLASEGSESKAVGMYRDVLRRYPKFAPAMAALAELLFDTKDTQEEAYSLATRARQTLRDDAKLTALLGRLAYERDDTAYAAQLLAEARKQRPKDPAVLYYLGMAQIAEEKTDAGLSTLRELVEIGGDSKFVAMAEEAISSAEEAKSSQE